MFPEEISKKPFFFKISYRIFIYIFLIIWLIPFFGIILTSFRSFEDISVGNYWGWPEKFIILENYNKVFQETSLLKYFFNSLVITIPSVIATLFLSLCQDFLLQNINLKETSLYLLCL